MKSALTTLITEEADISEVIETVKLQVKDAKLPDIEVVQALWDVLIDAKKSATEFKWQPCARYLLYYYYLHLCLYVCAQKLINFVIFELEFLSLLLNGKRIQSKQYSKIYVL